MSMSKWARFCICNRQERPCSSEQGRKLRDLCIPRSLPRWYDPDPLGGLSPAHLQAGQCGNQIGAKFWEVRIRRRGKGLRRQCARCLNTSRAVYCRWGRGLGTYNIFNTVEKCIFRINPNFPPPPIGEPHPIAAFLGGWAFRQGLASGKLRAECLACCSFRRGSASGKLRAEWCGWLLSPPRFGKRESARRVCSEWRKIASGDVPMYALWDRHSGSPRSYPPLAPPGALEL